MAKDKVEIEIRAEDKASKKLEKFSKDAEKHLGRVGKAAGGLSKGFLSLGTAMKGAFVAGAAAITAAVYTAQRIVRDSISAASALEEVQNKFNVVFRDQIQVAEEWADALRESYLMSRREAKEYLASIQDLLVPMGMASEEAGKLSFEVTKLAADLGSFNNLPTAQVMSDIQSALVGNYETMKKYGVVLTAAAVEQRALNMGLASTKGELTAAHKAQAAYNIMVEDSAAAIGDVARSSGSYANQVKQFKANLEDLRVVVGKSLLPTVTDVVSRMNEWVKANEAMIQQKIPEYWDRAATAAGKFYGVAEKAIDLMSKVTWGGAPVFETKEEKLIREIDELEEELKRLEEWEPNIVNKIFGQEKEWARIDELRGKLEQLQQEYFELEQKTAEEAEAAKKSAEEIKKGAEETKKGAEAAEKGSKMFWEWSEGAKETAGNYSQIKITSEETAENFSKMKTASEEAATSFKERSKELEKQNEELRKQIRLLKQATIEAAKPGVVSHTKGGLVFQKGGPVPGFGGGDRIPGLLEPGEFVLRKEAVRDVGINLLNTLNRGIGQQQGYHLIRFEFGGESHSLRVMEDTDVVEAFVRGLQRCEKSRGVF